MEETNATRIRETIIDLADRLESKKELWEAWKTLNKAMSYLSAKHTMAEVKQKNQDERGGFTFIFLPPLVNQVSIHTLIVVLVPRVGAQDGGGIFYVPMMLIAMY